jgi:DNA-directed RNA polymerase specialized sigma24 family protein
MIKTVVKENSLNTFEEGFASYGEGLLYYVFKMVNSWHDAEDIVQDGF